MLGISTALNALSVHGACTAVFVAVAAVAGGALASIQTFGKIGGLAYVGIACILTASKSRDASAKCTSAKDTQSLHSLLLLVSRKDRRLRHKPVSLHLIGRL